MYENIIQVPFLSLAAFFDKTYINKCLINKMR